MTFKDVTLLYALAIVPVLVVAFALDGQRRRRLAERIGHLPMIELMTASFSPARRRWRAVLMTLGVALAVVALARPQLPGRAKLTESRGLDVVVALDFSKSMLARDVYPTRLDRAKAELGRFIDNLKGDRVGLIAFAGETLSYPLTVDYEAAKLFWRDLLPSDMPVGGTDLGRALDAAIEVLTRVRAREGKKRPAQVIVLITDGEDTEGAALTAAKKAGALGIRIYTIGIGSGDKPPVPLFDEDGRQNGYVTDESGEPVRVGLDEASLKQIASVSGGDYTALDARRFGVERVQQAIAGLERTEEAARFEREPDDIGRWFLVPAFLALVAAACVRERRRPASARAAAATPVEAERALAAALLVLLWPLLSGFDLLKRKDPNLEAGNKSLAAGKADEALKAYDRAVQALPDEPIAHFDRGVALYHLGQFPEAQKEFLRASEGRDAELKADAYYNMGNALSKQERYKDALEAYKHALAMRPEDRRAKWNLELALRKLREQKQEQQQPKQAQQQKQDQQKQDQQKQDQQQKQEQQKQEQQAQQQQQQQQQQQDQKQKQEQEQQQQQQQAQRQNEKPDDKQRPKRVEAREIDKQDAEAVLDALERVEPTVQKDLARRRAGARRPVKDW